MNLNIFLNLLSYAILFYFLYTYRNKNEELKTLLTEAIFINGTIKDELEANKRLCSETQINNNKLLMQSSRQEIQLELLKTKHSSELNSATKLARQDALKKSRAVIRGQATEHLAPFIIPNTNPKDYRFMGSPIDYICFEGLSDILDGKADTITRIRFIDVKTGKSKLSKSQRKIRDAINTSEKQVTFEVINLDTILEEREDATSPPKKLEDSITTT
jgi:predicted Holliday junction resolvase-like endonuclease